MFNRESGNEYAPICNLVPGYAFYSGIGYGLAENLLDLVEWLLGLRNQVASLTRQPDVASSAPAPGIDADACRG